MQRCETRSAAVSGERSSLCCTAIRFRDLGDLRRRFPRQRDHFVQCLRVIPRHVLAVYPCDEQRRDQARWKNPRAASVRCSASGFHGTTSISSGSSPGSRCGYRSRATTVGEVAHVAGRGASACAVRAANARRNDFLLLQARGWRLAARSRLLSMRPLDQAQFVAGAPAAYSRASNHRSASSMRHHHHRPLAAAGERS